MYTLQIRIIQCLNDANIPPDVVNTVAALIMAYSGESVLSRSDSAIALAQDFVELWAIDSATALETFKQSLID